MLQKPSKTSKSKDHTRYLQKRLQLWKDGEIFSLLREGKEIQNRMTKAKTTKPQQITKVFTRLIMLQGKVSSALKWINRQSGGILEVNDEVLQNLIEKHPSSQGQNTLAILEGPIHKIEPVIFEEIDGSYIQKAAFQTRGSGGPTGIDADGWRRILCNKSYKTASQNLSDSVARLARRLCTDTIDPTCIREFTASRLIPLDKNPGVRPIGVGEVLRRIIGKSITMLLKPDITDAAGPLQTCAGQEGGIEAAVHAMKDIFNEEDSEALLLVDATNAFNSLNREGSLYNMQIVCPETSTYLIITYRNPAHLYISNSRW